MAWRWEKNKTKTQFIMVAESTSRQAPHRFIGTGAQSMPGACQWSRPDREINNVMYAVHTISELLRGRPALLEAEACLCDNPTAMMCIHTYINKYIHK